ncbi:MAG: nucleoside-diphosphate kinase [Pseudomonadota bacterium]
MEKTLSIIKPDAVANGHVGDIIKRFETNSFRIVAMKMVHLTKEIAEGFYAVHKNRPFFDSLTMFMSSGTVVIMVLNGDDAIARNRRLMGATDPKEADTGTIRKDFATNKEQNAVHGSDSPESASFEISYFFNQMELYS